MLNQLAFQLRLIVISLLTTISTSTASLVYKLDPSLQPTPYPTATQIQSSQTTQSIPTPSSQLATPRPTPLTTPRLQPPQPSSPNYQIEPDPDGREGFYVMNSIPDPSMSTVAELNSAVNQYRQTHGLNQLTIEPAVCDIAATRAIEIDSNFSHDQFSDHVQNGDYNHLGFSSIGENLWSGQFSGVHIVEFGWDRTDGHRANLQGDWTRGCAGIYNKNAVFVFAR